MRTSFLPRMGAALLAISLFGVGCIPSRQQTVAVPQPVKPFGKPPSGTGSAMAFGKLPTFALADTAATAQKGSAMMAPQTAEGVMAAPSQVRPIPSPFPKPVTVEYTIDATLPSWGPNGDVLLVANTPPDAAAVGQLARNAGLPTQTLENTASITSVNLQWRDERLQWTFDTGNRNVGFWQWKEPQVRIMGEKAQEEKERRLRFTNDQIIKFADTFLDARGFASIRQTGGIIEEWPVGVAMMGGVERSDAIPCPMMETKESMPSPAIWPSPCGWWPETAMVKYGGMREGKAVTDAYGNPMWTANVNVMVNAPALEINGGNLQLDQQVIRSPYPLIDAETAKKRLQSGGRNPVWPWGSESGTIKVRMAAISIVWIRYDSWENGSNATYLIPGLLATGTVNRGIKGQTEEPFRTVIPLVDDSAFEESIGTPTPVPLGMPALPATAPAAQKP